MSEYQDVAQQARRVPGSERLSVVVPGLGLVADEVGQAADGEDGQVVDVCPGGEPEGLHVQRGRILEPVPDLLQNGAVRVGLNGLDRDYGSDIRVRVVGVVVPAAGRRGPLALGDACVHHREQGRWHRVRPVPAEQLRASLAGDLLAGVGVVNPARDHHVQVVVVGRLQTGRGANEGGQVRVQVAGGETDQRCRRRVPHARTSQIDRPVDVVPGHLPAHHPDVTHADPFSVQEPAADLGVL